MQAARIADARERLERFDELLFAHVGYSIRNAVRSLVLGLSFGKFTTVPHDRKTAKYYQKLSRYSASLAFVSDVAMLTLGGKLKQKEHISARLGDVLSHLYICSAMLKRFESQGRPAADQAILAWAFHNAIYQIQLALRLVVDNFPNRYLRTILRLVVFPFGRREKAPGDRLTHKVAQLLLVPSDTRDRLTQGVYRSDTSNHPICFMERALPQVIQAEPLERRLLKALKQGDIKGITWEEQVRNAIEKHVLSKEEADILVAGPGTGGRDHRRGRLRRRRAAARASRREPASTLSTRPDSFIRGRHSPRISWRRRGSGLVICQPTSLLWLLGPAQSLSPAAACRRFASRRVSGCGALRSLSSR